MFWIKRRVLARSLRRDENHFSHEETMTVLRQILPVSLANHTTGVSSDRARRRLPGGHHARNLTLGILAIAAGCAPALAAPF
jgi:hypothetical protein